MFVYFQNLKSSIVAVTVVFTLLFSQPTIAQDTADTKSEVSTTQRIGDVILFALPAVTLGSSLAIGDKEGAWQFTKGLLLIGGITYGLKLGVNKQRPDKSDDNSFPSGHTSTVFHSAGFLHRRYGFKYSIPAYVLAGFTAASRIDSKKHDILDIIAGAAIGLGGNLLLTTEYQQDHMEITYSSFEGNHMIGFKYKF
jgi:membrane-associated phospholipid phosphatase